MKKKFSIILNSRGRPAALNQLIYSIYKQTKVIDDVEILLSMDNDDHETNNLINRSVYKFLFSYTESIPRDKHLHRRLNKLAGLAKGKYIFVMNDDCEIDTKHWDQKAWEALEASGQDIVYGRTRS